MRAPHFSLVALVFSLAACGQAEPTSVAAPVPAGEAKGGAPSPKQATASPLAQLDKKQFGAPITEATTTPLATLLGEPSRFGGKTIRTEGIVSAVCQSMGCWMEIADDAGNAHIKMAGHAFFVPKTSSGHRAVVQGRMATSPDEGGSCAERDGCRGEAEKQTGRVAKVEIEATGIEFLD